MSHTYSFSIAIGRRKDKTARRELDRVDAALGWKFTGLGRVESIHKLQDAVADARTVEDAKLIGHWNDAVMAAGGDPE